jgi:ABC-type siderophore export system fused ATPase/permease subunit
MLIGLHIVVTILVPLPPSMPMPRRHRLPQHCAVTSLNPDVASLNSLTLSTLLCFVQSAGIVLGVIALFIGLISSMMICGVVRLERDSLRVLVS